MKVDSKTPYDEQGKKSMPWRRGIVTSIFFLVMIAIVSVVITSCSSHPSSPSRNNQHTVTITEADDGKTVSVHVGDLVEINVSSITGIYMSNNTLLQAIAGVTAPEGPYPVGGAYPAKYAFGLAGHAKPLFRIVSQGVVDIYTPVCLDPLNSVHPRCIYPGKTHQFKLLATP